MPNDTMELNEERTNHQVDGQKAAKLTKQDINKAYWIWQFFSHANYNYERMQGSAFAASMTPIIDRLYTTKEEKSAALKRHLNFFNTNPNVGTVIHGLVIAMEEEKANGAEIDDDYINSVKTGLMGPLAGIGDSLDQGVAIPIIVALGISLGIEGNLFGPILVLLALPLIFVLVARFFWMQGYAKGNTAISNMLSGGKTQSLIGAAGILGCTVLGALISQYVSLSTALTFNLGEDLFDLQTGFFDVIMPNLLPFALTLGVYGVLRKGKISALQIMVALIIFSFVGVFLGIL